MKALTWVCFHHYLFLGYVLNVFSCLHGILGLNADTLTPIAALGYIRTRSPVSWEFYCCKLNVKDLDVVVRQRSDFFVSLWAWPGTCRTAFSQTLHSVSNCCLQIRVLFFFLSWLSWTLCSTALQNICSLTKQTAFCITHDLLTMLVNCKYS